MKLVLTAGGKGARLRPLTYEVPKPMLKIANKPVLEYAIEWAKENGLNDVIICAGYLAEHIVDYFGDGSRFGVSIRYSIEKEPLGTGGAIAQAKNLIGDNDFILLHGDILCEVDSFKLIDFHERNDAICTLVVHKSSHPHDSDMVEVNSQNKVIKFWRKPHESEPSTDLCNLGLHVFNAKALQYFPKGKSSLENDIIPKLVSLGEMIFAYNTSEFLEDIGTFKRLEALRSTKY